jgi:hypothetical protein
MKSFLIHLADSVELDCIWRAGEVWWVSLSAGEESERSPTTTTQQQQQQQKIPA